MNYDFILKDRIDDLLDFSPSDAGAISNIIKTKDGYSGVLQVFSTQGKFIAEATGRDLNEMIKSLFKLMYKEIKIWKKGRFNTQVV